MTDTFILDSIAFEPDLGGLLRKLCLEEQDEHAETVRRLVQQARAIAQPKAMYRAAYIDSKSDNTVVTDGIVFTSRVLRVNLDKAHRVFPYVATCGQELQAWSRTITDFLERFWADTIMEAALRSAMQALEEHITQHHLFGRSAVMSPGSLADWPIEQQRPLFALLGNPHEAIGVELTDSLLMVPIKSVSGLRFPTEVRFESCQLCPRDRCPGRRARYDPELYAKRYAPDGT